MSSDRTERDIHRDILRRPDDVRPRIEMADFLMRRDSHLIIRRTDPLTEQRAEFILTEHTDGRHPFDVTMPNLRDALRGCDVQVVGRPEQFHGGSFVEHMMEAERQAVPPSDFVAVFLRHGYVEAIAIERRRFVERARELFHRQPVRWVYLTRQSPAARRQLRDQRVLTVRYKFCWDRGGGVLGSWPEATLPDRLFDCLPDAFDRLPEWSSHERAWWSAGQAYGALAEACVEYGRNRMAGVDWDPRWLTAEVVDLARTISVEKCWERLPHLADALMDGGCGDEGVLGHCRTAEPRRYQPPHSWVCDLVARGGFQGD